MVFGYLLSRLRRLVFAQVTQVTNDILASESHYSAATSHDDLSLNNNQFIIKKDIIPAHFSITPFVRIHCLTVLYVLTVNCKSRLAFYPSPSVSFLDRKSRYGEDRIFCHLVCIIKGTTRTILCKIEGTEDKMQYCIGIEYGFRQRQSRN